MALSASTVLCSVSVLTTAGAEVLDVVVGARTPLGKLEVDADDVSVTHFDGLSDTARDCRGVLIPEELRPTFIDFVSKASETEGAGHKDLLGCAPTKIR